MRDHYFEGKVILPAVEALIILAKVVNLNFPQMDISCLLKARFPRFLLIEPETKRQTIFVDIDNTDEGNIAAVLLTSAKSKKGAISLHWNTPAWNLPLMIPLSAPRLLFEL